jgi:hypothetical protein
MGRGEKNCQQCGVLFTRDQRNTWAYWDKAKYCGQRCAGLANAARLEAQRPSIEDKFNLYFEKGDGCWPWTGITDKDGYGLLEYEGKMWRAGILALKLDGRPVPAGHYACHTCDNPPCVRPDHLYPGTPTQNSADAINRGRVCRGEHVHFSKLTAEDVAEIRRTSETHEIIADRYGVSRAAITLVKLRQTWKHVP